MNYPPQANRRGLFSDGFQSLLQGIADAADLDKSMAFLGFDRSFVRLRRSAMATDFEIYYCNYEKSEMRKTAFQLLDEVDRIEDLLSIWRPSSELKEVNARAAYEPVRVSKEVYTLVKLAKRIFSQTNGAYDLTSTPLTRCWGFFQRQGRVPTQGEIEEARSKVGMEYVELDDREQTIRFTREGVELSPASMGKGFALDSALQIAQRKGLETVLMHGGHSSVLASGAPAWRSAWQIDVRNPLDHESPLARLAVTQPGVFLLG
ncbi:MAG: FAD:protein FMN transferase [bacterium]